MVPLALQGVRTQAEAGPEVAVVQLLSQDQTSFLERIRKPMR